ncbi:MAG: Myb-like DNA-binding domain-containing protein [Alphaproteobacteria bacterium]
MLRLLYFSVFVLKAIFAQDTTLDSDTESSLNHILTRKAPTEWTKEDNERLRNAVEIHGGKNWKAISEHVTGRTAQLCLHHWRWLNCTKAPWTETEKATLLTIMQKRQELKIQQGEWVKIASELSSTTGRKREGKQCREKWINILNPAIDKSPPTLAELQKIIVERQNGKSWVEIAIELPGRTESQVKNWYNSKTHKSLDGEATADATRGTKTQATAAVPIPSKAPKKRKTAHKPFSDALFTPDVPAAAAPVGMSGSRDVDPSAFTYGEIPDDLSPLPYGEDELLSPRTELLYQSYESMFKIPD